MQNKKERKETKTKKPSDVKNSIVWCHLNGGGTPRDELGQFALADALEALVDLRRVDLALDDVQDGRVAVAVGAVALRRRRHHHVLRLQQPPHHVQHRRLAHRRLLFSDLKKNKKRGADFTE